jgi:hypothetical protein
MQAASKPSHHRFISRRFSMACGRRDGTGSPASDYPIASHRSGRLNRIAAMKTLPTLLAVAALTLAAGAADAKGCLKGAVVGGVAGHYAVHHGVLGAVAGCIYGRRHAKEQARQQQGQGQAPGSAPGEKM